MAEEHQTTSLMVLPVSKETYFNTKWKSTRQQLCPYDMVFHPPDYDQKTARSDRTDPQVVRKNIWEQEYHKIIPSTTHFQLGRPIWKPYDLTNKQFARCPNTKIPICDLARLYNGLRFYMKEHLTTVCSNFTTRAFVESCLMSTIMWFGLTARLT